MSAVWDGTVHRLGFFWGLAALSSLAHAQSSQRLNSDPVTSELTPPGVWDYLSYYAAEDSGSLDFDRLNEEYDLVSRELADLDEDDTNERYRFEKRLATLCYQRVQLNYHDLRRGYLAAFRAWEAAGRKGTRPGVSLTEVQDLLQECRDLFQKVAFDYKDFPPTDRQLLTLAELVSLDDGANAIYYLEQVQKDFSGTTLDKRAQLLTGVIYFTNSDLRQAFGVFKELVEIEEFPVRILAQYFQGWVYRQQTRSRKRRAEAPARLTEVVQNTALQPESQGAQALAHRASLDLVAMFAQKNDVRAAESLFLGGQATEFFLLTIERIAHRHQKNGNIEGALQLYRQVIDVAPLDAKAPVMYLKILKTLAKLRDHEGLLDALTKFEEMVAPDSAWMATHPKKKDDAKEIFLRALERFAGLYERLQRNRKDLRPIAVAMLEMYLRHFEDAEDTLEMRGRLAAMQAKQGFPARAAKNYRLIRNALPADSEPRYRAAQKMLQMMERTVNALGLPDPDLGHPMIEPLPLPRPIEAWIQMCEEHYREYSKSAFDGGIYLKAADRHYAYGYYGRATTIWREVTENNKATPAHIEALSRLIAHYLLAQEWRKLLDFALQAVKTGDRSIRQQAVDGIAQAVFPLAQGTAQDRPQQAVDLLLILPKLEPTHEHSPQALRDGFRILQEAGSAKRMIEVGTLMMRLHPRSPLLSGVIAPTAELLAGQQRYTDAAAALRIAINLFRGHLGRPKAMMDRARYLTLAGELQDAALQYDQVTRQHGKHPKAGSALIAAAELYHRLEKGSRRLAALQATQGGRYAVALPDQLEGAALLAIMGKRPLPVVVREIATAPVPVRRAQRILAKHLSRGAQVAVAKAHGVLKDATDQRWRRALPQAVALPVALGTLLTELSHPGATPRGLAPVINLLAGVIPRIQVSDPAPLRKLGADLEKHRTTFIAEVRNHLRGDLGLGQREAYQELSGAIPELKVPDEVTLAPVFTIYPGAPL